MSCSRSYPPHLTANPLSLLLPTPSHTYSYLSGGSPAPGEPLPPRSLLLEGLQVLRGEGISSKVEIHFEEAACLQVQVPGSFHGDLITSLSLQTLLKSPSLGLTSCWSLSPSVAILKSKKAHLLVTQHTPCPPLVCKQQTGRLLGDDPCYQWGK